MFLNHEGDYDSIRAAFSWDGRVPEFLNLAYECCERWAGDRQRLALIYEHADKTVERYTYAESRIRIGQFSARRRCDLVAGRLVVDGRLRRCNAAESVAWLYDGRHLARRYRTSP